MPTEETDRLLATWQLGACIILILHTYYETLSTPREYSLYGLLSAGHLNWNQTYEPHSGSQLQKRVTGKEEINISLIFIQDQIK